MSVRRLLLDPILMEAAAAAGAEVWIGAKVTKLVRDRGRVTGVRATRNGSMQVLETRLVVGADGRNSTVARLAGSRKYNLTANERFTYWSFFEEADPGAEPTVILHRWSGNFVMAIPADSGLYLVLALPELSELAVAQSPRGGSDRGSWNATRVRGRDFGRSSGSWSPGTGPLAVIPGRGAGAASVDCGRCR